MVFSQNTQQDIESQFRDYNSLIADKNFDKAFDLYANEDFLEMFPKEQMVQMMNQLFNMEGMEVKIYKPEEVSVSTEIIEQKNKKYVPVHYRQKMDIKFSLPNVATENVLSALKGTFGLENVKYNEQSQFFEINAAKQAVASSSDSKNWKFTIIEKKQIPFLKQFIPEEFLKNLK